ncbi:MAG: hypothetical protein Ct9H300mP11_30300 [Chloroflexota bacterium]|nr:MAG: hypothetical protein Ct9H300mP11_30300 [Chloroflexota bacterium]
MERAEGAYIPLMELEEKAGAAIAKMVNVPAAYITSGAGSALTLAPPPAWRETTTPKSNSCLIPQV